MSGLNLLANHEDLSRDVIHGLLRDVLALTESKNDGTVAPWEMAAAKFAEAAEVCAKTAQRNGSTPAKIAAEIFTPILATLQRSRA